MLLVCGAVCAQPEIVVAESVPKGERIQRAGAPPTIDGVLDEEIWLRAPIIDDFHQVNPVEYAQPSERTEVYLLYDLDSLYIGARLFDSDPSAIVARVLRQNQAINTDDRFFLHIDPFNSSRGGYFFGVNPNGVRFDGIYDGPTQRQGDWDGIWQAAANITDEGWTLEIEIPFKTISFDPSTDTWRMNFQRTIQHLNESIAWESRNRNIDLTTMGDISGISQIDQGVGLDIVPSVIARDRRAFPGVTALSESDASLDVFYKITPQLNGSLTINTDFSATEVDDRQVNLTRFSLFFPERRDFFLQDVDIFQFGRLDRDGRPFFSRRLGISDRGQVVPLNVGGKVSGRIGRFDVGTLVVQQDAFEDIEATTAFVGRVAAQVLGESSVGMIITDGDPASNLDNSVFGVDFRYLNSRFAGGRQLQGEAWVQQSDTPGMVGDDTAFGVAARVPSNVGFGGSIGYSEIEANFNPALGFARRRGISQTDLSANHRWRPSGGRIRSFLTEFGFNRIEYLDTGDVQSEVIELQAIGVEFNSQDETGITFSRNTEGLRRPFEISPGIIIPTGTYTFDRTNLRLRSGNQRRFTTGLFINYGDFYTGERFGATTFITWRQNRNFQANLRYAYNEVDLPEGSFETRVVRLTLTTAFSSRLSWVNQFQYDNVSENLGLNSRLHWIPRAGREAFLVFNHNLEDYDKDNNFHSNQSEMTLKYSYTFRF